MAQMSHDLGFGTGTRWRKLLVEAPVSLDLGIQEASEAGDGRKQLKDLILHLRTKVSTGEDSPHLAVVVIPPVISCTCTCRGPCFLKLWVLLPSVLLPGHFSKRFRPDPPLVARILTPHPQGSPIVPRFS